MQVFWEIFLSITIQISGCCLQLHVAVAVEAIGD